MTTQVHMPDCDTPQHEGSCRSIKSRLADTETSYEAAREADAIQMVAEHDAVNHPAHYKQGGIEVIDAIEAWELGFCLGNTVKYVARAGKKDTSKTLEDLKKARWYLDREISRRDTD